MTRLVELFQQGWPIVIVVLPIDATGQRGSVHRPSPPRYTNSIALGLRQFAIGSPDDVVYPVEVWLTDTGSGPVARWARMPLM